MTKEQEKRLVELNRELKRIFPDFYGSVRFNLNPKRTKANFNIEQSYVEPE